MEEKYCFLKIIVSFYDYSCTNYYIGCLRLICNEKPVNLYELLTNEWPSTDIFTKLLIHEVSFLQILEGITARNFDRFGELGGKKVLSLVLKDFQHYFLLHIDLKIMYSK